MARPQTAEVRIIID